MPRLLGQKPKRTNKLNNDGVQPTKGSSTTAEISGVGNRDDWVMAKAKKGFFSFTGKKKKKKHYIKIKIPGQKT